MVISSCPLVGPARQSRRRAVQSQEEWQGQLADASHACLHQPIGLLTYVVCGCCVAVLLCGQSDKPFMYIMGTPDGVEQCT
jgi:hypothetical protein